MKKTRKSLFLGVVIGICLVFLTTGCMSVSSSDYASARARTLPVPPGQARVTYTSLNGLWQNTNGEYFIFDNGVFRSNTQNDGRVGSFDINNILSSFQLVFYRDRNLEFESITGYTAYFEGRETSVRRQELDMLAMVTAVLSENGRTLSLDGIIYNKAAN